MRYDHGDASGASQTLELDVDEALRVTGGRRQDVLLLAVVFQRGPPEEWMSGAGGDHEVLLRDHSRRKALGNVFERGDDEIDGATLQLLEGVLRKDVSHTDVDARRAAPQVRDQARQDHR